MTKDGVQIGLRLDGDVLRTLEDLAEADGVNVQEYIRRLLRRHVARKK